MQQFYADAFLSKPPIVFGRQLLPFTLGHWFLLLACNSPFVVGGKIKFSDLIFATWACSQPSGMPHGDGMRSQILDNTFKTECEKWGQSFKNIGYTVHEEALREYFKVYMQFPPRGEYCDGDGEQKRRCCRVPYPLAFVWRIAPVIGIKEAWNIPSTQALAYHAAACDSDGDKTLISEEEEIAEAEMLKKIEEAENGGQS